jgi:transposase
LHIETRLRGGCRSSKSDPAKAINYSVERWPILTHFLGDGKLCISNITAEQALGGIAVGRQNWPIAGSNEGGLRAAAIFTLVETELNDVDQSLACGRPGVSVRSRRQLDRRPAALQLADNHRAAA